MEWIKHKYKVFLGIENGMNSNWKVENAIILGWIIGVLGYLVINFALN